MNIEQLLAKDVILNFDYKFRGGSRKFSRGVSGAEPPAAGGKAPEARGSEANDF